MEDFNKIFAVEWAPTFTFGPLLCKLVCSPTKEREREGKEQNSQSE